LCKKGTGKKSERGHRGKDSHQAPPYRGKECSITLKLFSIANNAVASLSKILKKGSSALSPA
jgi:hypothetical protein